jgi:hypothetical protein
LSRVSADELTTAALKHSVRVDVLSVDDDGAHGTTWKMRGEWPTTRW